MYRFKPIVASMCVGMAFSAVGHAQSLQEAIQLTINENPEIQAKRSERRAVEEQISQARAGFFPTVDIAAGYGFEQSNSPITRSRGDGTVQFGREEASVMLRQMIFDGMATYNEVERHEARTDARAYAVFGQSEITALKGVQAYLDVLRRQELVEIAQENLLIHQRTDDQIRMRAERGIGKKADIDQSRGRVALAESNLKAEEGNLRDAQTAFLRVIGVLPGKLEAANDPTEEIPANLDEAVDKAVANHPVLKSANADIDSAYSQHETAKSPYFPRIDFEVGASHNNDLDGVRGKNEDLTAMVRLRYNLFNGGKDWARRGETAHLINQAKDIRDDTYRQVVESMRLSWVAYQTIDGQMEFFRNHRDASIKTLEAYQKQFNIGQRTLLDLLDSTNEVYLAKAAYINASYDLLYAKYRVLAGMGALNRFLGVKLPEEIEPIREEESS